MRGVRLVQKNIGSAEKKGMVMNLTVLRISEGLYCLDDLHGDGGCLKGRKEVIFWVVGFRVVLIPGFFLVVLWPVFQMWARSLPSPQVGTEIIRPKIN